MEFFPLTILSWKYQYDSQGTKRLSKDAKTGVGLWLLVKGWGKKSKILKILQYKKFLAIFYHRACGSRTNSMVYQFLPAEESVEGVSL